jgi:hypothetical protein
MEGSINDIWRKLSQLFPYQLGAVEVYKKIKLSHEKHGNIERWKIYNTHSTGPREYIIGDSQAMIGVLSDDYFPKCDRFVKNGLFIRGNEWGFLDKWKEEDVSIVVRCMRTDSIENLSKILNACIGDVGYGITKVTKETVPWDTNECEFPYWNDKNKSSDQYEIPDKRSYLIHINTKTELIKDCIQSLESMRSKLDVRTQKIEK